jgi:hypothetical protein
MGSWCRKAPSGPLFSKSPANGQLRRASLPWDFKEYVKSGWVAATSRYISYLEDLLDLYHGEPDYWAEDVLSLIEELTDFTLHQSAAAPRELRETQSPEQAMEICRRVVRKYGELLRWWPVVHGTAGALRAEGICLARPI